MADWIAKMREALALLPNKEQVRIDLLVIFFSLSLAPSSLSLSLLSFLLPIHFLLFIFSYSLKVYLWVVPEAKAIAETVEKIKTVKVGHTEHVAAPRGERGREREREKIGGEKEWFMQYNG